MTADEFERYGMTDMITFGQMACLDAERANAKASQERRKRQREKESQGS